MNVSRYKPTTPGRRHAQVMTTDKTKRKPAKSLTSGISKTGGRNSQGKITVRHQGGGHKRKFRTIDFKREKYDIPAKVVSIEYDPNRSASIALLHYADGTKQYMLAPKDLAIGMEVVSSKKETPIQSGNRLPLDKIPTGMMVYNVELIPGKGGQLGRSAGTGITLLTIEGKYAHLRMPSSEVRMIPKEAMATLGTLSNEQRKNVRLGKAGRMRWRGIRPTVRGKAMNPVDHPHGGGEGSSPIGMKNPKTPWGKVALGVRTRRNGKFSDTLIIRRRKAKR